MFDLDGSKPVDSIRINKIYNHSSRRQGETFSQDNTL